MTDQLIKRIYFDTNQLQGWPYVSNSIAYIFRAANWLNTELYIPATVEDELERQFVRDVNAAFREANSGAQELKKLFRGVLPVEFVVPHVSDDALRRAFRARSTQMKEFFHISTIPLVEIPSGVLVGMAINRQPPFEEVNAGKERTVVTGLQDTAIILSIIEHLRSTTAGDRNSFVSSDGVFRKPETRELIERHGVNLEIFKEADDLWKSLFEHIWEAIRIEWSAEIKQIRDALDAAKETLAIQLLPMLPTAEIGGYKTIKEVKALRIKRFSHVVTVLPEQDQRPPVAQTYKRAEGSTVQISANAEIELDIKVQKFSLTDYLLNLNTQGVETQFPVARIEDMTINPIIKLSLTGEMHEGIVTNFKITDVQVEKGVASGI
jgi:hypothetical protein